MSALKVVLGLKFDGKRFPDAGGMSPEEYRKSGVRVFSVKSIKNSIEWTISQELDEKQVQEIIDRGMVEVVIS